MRWSVPVSSPVPPRSPQPDGAGDRVDTLLTDRGLALVDGLWCDAVRTVGVARAPAGLFVGWIDVGWIAPDTPFDELRDAAHLVENVPDEHLRRDLGFALDEARRVRTAHLRECHRCGERFVPGQMHGPVLCHECAVHAGDAPA